ncbi:MAG: L-type lectin-domain containing protein, partial [Bacteroidota bacterium]
MKQLLFTFGILLLSFHIAFSQTYTTAGLATNPGGTCFCLSDGSGSSASQVWQDNGYTLSDFMHPSGNPLTWETEVYLGANDGGGHGIAFVIQAEGDNAGGNEGAPLGYGGASGIVPSIAIEIDTYGNTFDPTTDDHLSIHSQGNHKSPFTGTTPVALPNVEDDRYHALQITWTYNPANPALSTLTATLDGTYSITATMDISLFFNSTRPIYVGFTGGTNGLATNVQKASFGAVGTGGTCSALSLPIELLSFEVSSLATQEVELSWATAWEQNNDRFEILRSTDAAIWENVGNINGAGNSSEVRTYQYTDQVPFQGRVYYQLKQVDYDGTFSYSEILQVDAGFQQAFTTSLFPNPASEQSTLSIVSKEKNEPPGPWPRPSRAWRRPRAPPSRRARCTRGSRLGGASAGRARAWPSRPA